MNLHPCALPGCARCAVGDAPLCQPHLIRLSPEACDGLLSAWRVYELSQATADATEYTRLLRACISELGLKSPMHSPQQLRLRLVK